MRTTLSLDEDVSVLLERIRKQKGRPLREIVNEALRAGLERIDQPQRPKKRYRLRPFSVGKCRIENFDDIGGILAILERDELP